MAAVNEYPSRAAPLVRGDPVEIPVHIRKNGVGQDVSTYTWRAQIRAAFDGTLITEFTTTVMTWPGDTVPNSTVRLTLTDIQSRLLQTGYVFDVEQLDAPPPAGKTIRTWWICPRINVQRDVSYNGP